MADRTRHILIGGGRRLRRTGLEFDFIVGGEKRSVRLDGRGPNMRVAVGGREYDVDWHEARGGVFSMIVDGRSHPARVVRRDGGLMVWIDGLRVKLDLGTVDDDTVGVAGAARGRSGVVKAPMPGTVVKVLVSEGDEVSPGRSLVIVEAMKMENEVRSQIDGVVRKVNVAAGDSVGTTEVMVEIEPSGSDG